MVVAWVRPHHLRQSDVPLCGGADSGVSGTNLATIPSDDSGPVDRRSYDGRGRTPLLMVSHLWLSQSRSEPIQAAFSGRARRCVQRPAVLCSLVPASLFRQLVVLMEPCGPRIAGLLDLSADPLKRVLQDEPSDRLAERLTDVGRRPEVNAREDARVLHFLERGREAAKRARDAEHQVGLHAETDAVLELMCQYGACRPTDARMTRRVIGMPRGREERHPRWVRRGVRDCHRPGVREWR